jgi:polyhydroxybutyrate depolymerase
LPSSVDDGTSVAVTRIGQCGGAAEVVRYTITDGGHTWPGGQQYAPAALVGKTSRNRDASLVICQFLRDHSDAQRR